MTFINNDSISERINSFIGWNVLFICPDEMARAGFYYTKHKDYVRCAYCEIELGNWTTGKSPISEHAYYSPQCNYVVELLESYSLMTSSSLPPHVEEHERRRLNDFYTCATTTATTTTAASSNVMACVVCMDRDRCIMFSPCKHIVCCDDCAVVVDSCVLCRSLIEYRTRIFLN
uniref:Iap3 n=1 Tax=Malacosoma sp. alphabaculovirus TaxID=1881632 RepID=A0A1B1V5M0_9ABAC|nr:iap3 [Malacosoma sp. alphabaculovirus]